MRENSLARLAISAEAVASDRPARTGANIWAGR